MNDNLLSDFYEKSILLIGPSGAGKSTIAAEINRITGLPRLCLDVIANNDRKNGIMKKFRNSDEYKQHMIARILNKSLESRIPGVVDFGAGHSVYDDSKIFENIKEMLRPFKNIILLLPTENTVESLEIMRKRSTGDTSENEKFIESTCNEELATMLIFGNGRNPSQIAKEIIDKISINKTKEINKQYN